MSGLFHELNRVSLGKTAVADTTSETDSAVEDMQDFEEITFIVNLGDVDAAAVMTFAVKENTASSTSSPTPTAVTLGTVSGLGSVGSGALVITEDSGNLDNKTLVITVKKSVLTKRYVFLAITATTESYEVVSIQTIKSAAKKLPHAGHASEVVSVAHGYA